MPGSRHERPSVPAAGFSPDPGSEPIVLRPARSADQAFILRVYGRAMGPLLRRAGVELQSQAELLAAQWNLAEMHVIVAAGRDVGWIQVAAAPGERFLRNICIDPDYQRLGIGSIVLRRLMRDAAAAGDAVALLVAKGNPAQRLYEALGFRLMHEDAQHCFMRATGLLP